MCVLSVDLEREVLVGRRVALGDACEGGYADIGAALAGRRLRMRTRAQSRVTHAHPHPCQIEQRFGRAPFFAAAAVRVLVARAAGDHQVRGGRQLRTHTNQYGT